MRAERENGIAGHFTDHVADQHACPATRFIKPGCSYRLFHRTSCMYLSTHARPIRPRLSALLSLAVFLPNRYTKAKSTWLGKNLFGAHAVD